MGAWDHTVRVMESARSPRYPAWMLRFNRAVTSRTLTYTTAALFALDGVVRLLDGRTARGMGNLVVATTLVLMRKRTRRAVLGENDSAESRAQWAADHPIAAAILLGAVWGAAMGLLLIITKDGPALPALLLGLGSGLLFFGPGTVLLSRRYRRREDLRPDR